jgi:site-specific recombinase XerD
MSFSSSAQVHPIHLVARDALTDQVREFLIDREARGLSKRTVEWYGEQLDHLESYARDAGIADADKFTPTLLRSFLIGFAKNHNPGGTAGLYRAVRAFLNWYANENEGYQNPIAKVTAPKVPPKVLEPVSLNDLRAMLATCTRRTFYGDRDKAALLVLLDSGCRRAEFLGLDVGDVNIQTGSVMVRCGKGGKPRMAFIGAKTRGAVLAYLRHRRTAQDTDPLWISEDGARLAPSALRAMLQRRAKMAGVPPPAPHSFRRGFAINALRAGVDLVSLQRLLGHSDLTVIRQYLSQTSEDLKAAHERSGPVDRMLR